MRVAKIIAAVDDSPAGRDALEAARLIAERTGAHVTALTAMAGPVLVGPGVEAASRFERGGIEYVSVPGWAGIEVPRFAESEDADLIVLGRKMRSEAARRFLGDTADSVARRSRVPCLFVPAGQLELGTIVVALDGSPRSRVVLDTACGFARAIGSAISAVTVERSGAMPAGIAAPPSARTEQIAVELRAAAATAGCPDIPLRVRSGDVVTEILREATEAGADVLVTGFHRGGPAGVLDAGSSARRLAHAAPMGFLSVPL